MLFYRQILAFLHKIFRRNQAYNTEILFAPPLPIAEQQEAEWLEEEAFEAFGETRYASDAFFQLGEVTEDFLEIWNTLTPREREVVALICIGFTSFDIGRLLFITEAAAKVHAEDIRYKFSASNRGQLKAILHPMETVFEAWARTRFGDELIDRWKLWGQLD